MKKEVKNFRRLIILAAFLLVLFCFIIIQFYKIQIIEGEKWKKQAKAQHQFVVREPFKRGRFLANMTLKEGHIQKTQALACDIKKYHLFIDPSSFTKSLHTEVVEALSTILQLNQVEQEHIVTQLNKQSRSRGLKKWLDDDDKKAILSWWRPFAKWKKLPSNILYFTEDFKRSYPYGPLLGAVLNTVRDDRENTCYQAIPTGGLELTCDEYLRGSPGEKLLLRSPRQSIENGVILSHSEDGADVYLTVDPYIQSIAEEEIEQAVLEAGAKCGWAVMMSPYTGEIYALAQYPGFDPSSYRTYYNDPELVEYTKVKAITDCFEPGSTMKPISVAIAFLANEELKKRGEEPLFDPSEMIPTSNGQFPGRSKPIRDVGHHRFLNMYLAIQKSSNIYVARLMERVVNRLGSQWYRDQLKNIFKFESRTGLELPYESFGLVPDPNRKYKTGHVEWSKPTPFSLSFGYNLSVNSIQLMRAWALIANGGIDIKPTLIKKVVKGEKVLVDYANKSVQQAPYFNKSVAREMIYALKATTKPGGSGRHSNVLGYTEVGKTGTTEKLIEGKYSNKHHFSSFIGFTPANNPQFLLFIAIDGPEYKKAHYGGQCAAPVFRKIMERTFKYLGTVPDDPMGTDWKEEVKTLKKLYSEWN